MKTVHRLVVLFSFSPLLISGCNRIPIAPPAAPEERQTSVAEPTPSPIPDRYPLPLDNDNGRPAQDGAETILLPIIAGPSVSLPENGPWLLILTAEGLTLLSTMEGTRASLSSDFYAGPPTLQTAISPTGRHLAYMTAADNRLHNLTLQVVSLPDLEIIQTITLSSPETEPTAEAGPGEPGYEIARTIASLDNLAWSPDGLRLAFTGAQNGTSADLHLLEVQTGQLAQLTQEPSQATRPRWAPDGQTLIYSGISSLRTGAGYGMTGVWAVPLDGTAPLPLNLPDFSGDERHLGWADQDTAVRYTFSPLCGTSNLRAVNVRTGEERIIWAGAFQAIAFDPTSANILVSIAALDETCNPSGIQGLILTHPEAQDALVVSDRNAFEIAWSSQAGQFLAATPAGIVAYDLFGQQTILPGAFDRLPMMDPAGDFYAWAQADFQGIPGIWLGEPETVPTQIYNGNAARPLWDPADSQLIFFDNEEVYKTDLINPPWLIAGGVVALDAVIIQTK